LKGKFQIPSWNLNTGILTCDSCPSFEVCGDTAKNYCLKKCNEIYSVSVGWNEWSMTMKHWTSNRLGAYAVSTHESGAFTKDRRKCTMVKVMMHVTYRDMNMANSLLASDFVSSHNVN
jgi:hypothetical protein